MWRNVVAAVPWLLVQVARAGEEKVQQLDEVVVSAPLQHRAEELARPVTVLSGEELRRKIGATIGATLQNEPGLTSQSFGPSVGQPVIRGQSGPRVQVMSNSLGNGDVAQLSPDHANGIEPVLADRIEVLRGPATLLYGSGAIGGIVNVIDNRVPDHLPERPLTVTGEQRYHSVSDQWISQLKLEGGQGPFALHLDGFYRDSGNLRIGGLAIDSNAVRQSDAALRGIELHNSDGVIPNTHARAKGGTVGASLVGEQGYAGASINYLGDNYGIPPEGLGGEPVRINLKQTRYDFKGELREFAPWVQALRLRFGYVDYTHTELDGGVAATVFTNRSYEGRLELAHQPFGPFQGVLGGQALSSDFAAVDSGAGQALVPSSQIESYGAFAVESFRYGPGRYEIGLRGETNSINPRGGPRRSYTPISVSGSGQWRIGEAHTVSLAVTRSQRAPQVQELFSHGVHDATHSYENGNPGLSTETSYNLDLGYRFKAAWVNATLDLFHNWVSDYIYQQLTGGVYNDELGRFQAVCSSPGACFPVVQSQQADAVFKGFEARATFPVLEKGFGIVDLTLFSDYTRGEFVRGGDVPRLPPLRYGLQLDYAYGNHWSAFLRLTRGERQDHPGANDSPTPGYVLLNLGLQYETRAFQDAKLLVFAMANNLLDENIRNSTSYLRNFAPEPGRGAELGLRISY
ncbi:TonB-dependent receptor [Candidatus Methylocalor cossyra]|uniref:Zinc-regulated outer membrane receptor n=1 Tax=Candidatus Methylocalor cossyra TaxID=3108543 RepID=A0ABP1CAL5_9GAMM